MAKKQCICVIYVYRVTFLTLTKKSENNNHIHVRRRRFVARFVVLQTLSFFLLVVLVLQTDTLVKLKVNLCSQHDNAMLLRNGGQLLQPLVQNDGAHCNVASSILSGAQ